MFERQLFVLLYAITPEAILEAVLIPLFPFLVKQLLPNEKEEDIGHYVGLLGSAFYLPLFLMNVVWGSLSDHHGRKPILLSGLVVFLATSLVIGIAQEYQTVWLCMLGDMAKTDSQRAWGYAMYGSVYGLAGIVGPLLGGLLSNPAELYPSLFPKTSIFARHPYLLTCSFGIILAIGAIPSTYLLLRELPKHTYKAVNSEETLDNVELDLLDDNPFEIRNSRQERPFSFLSPNVLGPITMYCIIAYTNMAYFTSVPLYFSTSRKNGGLEMNSRDTSFLLLTISLAKLCVQLLFFQRILFHLGGSRQTYRLAMALYVPGHLLISCLYLLPTSVLPFANFFLMCCFGIAESLAYLSVMLRITESVAPRHLGVAHGFASTMAALVRTIAPALTGSIWEWGHRLGWTSLVFFIGALTSLGGVVASFLVS
ncbi:major facilitator superfamily domain-containing protein [Gorgonomyces haynaldii]|nr:major facilitator superfamily domain-containing protein [Gorgonomyces haynaldii]